MIQSQQKVLRKAGPGLSIAAFARKSTIPYRRIEAAVRAGEIASVTLGGVTRIPDGEYARVMALYGIEVVDDPLEAAE